MPTPIVFPSAALLPSAVSVSIAVYGDASTAIGSTTSPISGLTILIVELGTTGIYTANITLPDSTKVYEIVWNDGAGNLRADMYTPAGGPAYGLLVAGSATNSIILSGLPPGSIYAATGGLTNQGLLRALTGEVRRMLSQTFNSGTGNYTLGFGGGSVELGAFSATPSLTVGELFYPLP